MSLLLSPLLIDYHKFPKQQKNISFTCGRTHPRTLWRTSCATPWRMSRLILENAKACITTSRTAMTEGVLSYHRVHVFVDTVILYFLSLIHRDTQTTFSNQVCPFKCQKFVKEMCPTILGSRRHS